MSAPDASSPVDPARDSSPSPGSFHPGLELGAEPAPARAMPRVIPPREPAGGGRPPAPRLESRAPALVGWVRETFLPSASARPGPPVPLQVLSAALFVAGAVTLLLLWRAHPGPAGLIWAEDGRDFLRDALTGSWSQNVTVPYAGYMHLVPRSIAELVPLFPADRWALALSVAAAAVRALLAVFVFYACAGVLPSRPARGAVAVIFVSLPLGAFEVLNSIANLHWFLLVAAVPALLWRPAGWAGVAAQCAVVAASMLSDPLTLIWSPLLVLRLVGLRTLKEHLVSLTFLASAAIQLAAVAGATRESGPGIGPGDGTMRYLIRVLEAAVAGFRFTSEDYRGGATPLMWVCVGVVLVVIAAGLSRPGPHRGFIVLCIGGGAGFYGVTLYFFPDPLSLLPPGPDLYLENASRYQVPPAVLLLAAVVAAGSGVLSALRGLPGAAHGHPRSPTGGLPPTAADPAVRDDPGTSEPGHGVSRGRRTAAGVLAGVFTLAGAFYVLTVVQVYRYHWPQQTGWAQAVADGRQTCALERPRAVVLSIDPQTWTVVVPCDSLR